MGREGTNAGQVGGKRKVEGSFSSSLDIQPYSIQDERRSIDVHQVREQEPGRVSRKNIHSGVDGQRSVESLSSEPLRGTQKIRRDAEQVYERILHAVSKAETEIPQ